MFCIYKIHNQQHRTTKFMFYDINKLFNQLDEIFKYGYTCTIFDEKCFKNRTCFSEDLPIFETKDKEKLMLAKQNLQKYVLNNLITQENIYEYCSEIVNEEFYDENIAPIWCIKDFYDLLRVLNLQSMVSEFIKCDCDYNKTLTEEQVNAIKSIISKYKYYFRLWFKYEKEINIFCHGWLDYKLNEIFENSDVIVGCDFNKFPKNTSRTIFIDVQAVNLNLPYFIKTDKYFMKPGKCKMMSEASETVKYVNFLF